MEKLLGRDLLYEVSKIRLDLTIKTNWLTGYYAPALIRGDNVRKLEKEVAWTLS